MTQPDGIIFDDDEPQETETEEVDQEVEEVEEVEEEDDDDTEDQETDSDSSTDSDEDRLSADCLNTNKLLQGRGLKCLHCLTLLPCPIRNIDRSSCSVIRQS